MNLPALAPTPAHASKIKAARDWGLCWCKLLDGHCPYRSMHWSTSSCTFCLHHTPQRQLKHSSRDVYQLRDHADSVREADCPCRLPHTHCQAWPVSWQVRILSYSGAIFASTLLVLPAFTVAGDLPAGPGLAQLPGFIGIHGQNGARLETPLQQQDGMPPDTIECGPVHCVAWLLWMHACLPNHMNHQLFPYVEMNLRPPDDHRNRATFAMTRNCSKVIKSL